MIAISRQHLSAIHKNAFDSPKLKLIHTDGFAYIQNHNNDHQENYDLILLDLTDPIAPNGSNLAQSCMSEEFFQACYRRLNHKGSLVLHLGSHFYHAERHQTTLERLRKSFDAVQPYAVFIPLYGALWGMAMATKVEGSQDIDDAANLSADLINERLGTQNINDLQHYNAQTHAAMFAIEARTH